MIINLIIILIVSYSALIAITTFLSNRSYSFRVFQFFNNGIITPLLHPIMYIFGYQKVTHWYDWQEFDKSKIEGKKSLEFNSKTTKRNIKQTFSFTNALVSLGSVNTAVIIQPVTYSGNWSLIFVVGSTCKVNTLQYTGKVKIIHDGSVSLYALGEDNKIYSIGLIETIDRSEKLEILHI
jgi:hypothetical protein